MPSSEAGSREQEQVVGVDTSEGPGRFFVAPAAAASVPGPGAVTLFLGHGAGGGVDATDLSILARGLPLLGITVVRFEQPWRTAGGRVAVRAPRLDAAWNEAVGAVLDGRCRLPAGPAGPADAVLPFGPDSVVLTGGRSAGARVACRTAARGPLADRVRGVVCCAFPLHLPGRPERSREAELLAPDQPRLVFQGERDTFGGVEEVAAVLRANPQADPTAIQLVPVPGADHSMRLARKIERTSVFGAAELRALLLEQTANFVRRLE